MFSRNRRRATTSLFTAFAVATSLLVATAGGSAHSADIMLSNGCPADPSTRDYSLRADELSSNVQSAWANGYYGDGVDVALIDTGVALVPGLSQNNVIYGPDFSLESQSRELRNTDTYGHGTSMASIIGARDSGSPTLMDTSKYWGVAPNARIVSVKVGDSQGTTDVTQLVAAIDWVREHKNAPDGKGGNLNIRVLSLSIGYASLSQSSYTDAISKAVDAAWKAGIVVVVAAGNGGKANVSSSQGLLDPGWNRNVVTVGAYDTCGTSYGSDDEETAFTSGSSQDNTRYPDIAAPGRSVPSLHVPGAYEEYEVAKYHDAALDPTSSLYTGYFFSPYLKDPNTRTACGDTIPYFCAGDRFIRGSGSSEATAFAAGAIAVLLSKKAGTNTWSPWSSWSNDEVKKALRTSARGNVGGRRQVGEGAIDLGKFMSSPRPSQVQSNAAVYSDYFENARGQATLTDDHGNFVSNRLTDPNGGNPLTGETDIFGNFSNGATTSDAQNANMSWWIVDNTGKSRPVSTGPATDACIGERYTNELLTGCGFKQDLGYWYIPDPDNPGQQKLVFSPTFGAMVWPTADWNAAPVMGMRSTQTSWFGAPWPTTTAASGNAFWDWAGQSWRGDAFVKMSWTDGVTQKSSWTDNALQKSSWTNGATQKSSWTNNSFTKSSWTGQSWRDNSWS